LTFLFIRRKIGACFWEIIMTSFIYTAFQGDRHLASGPLSEVALAVKRASGDEPILIFEDQTGQQTDLDTRGSDEQILARLAAREQEPAPRTRGRPKLGVVPREVTLLPRHWAWLKAQPGGASAALRRLVEEARRQSGGHEQQRQAQDAAYRFMAAMVGNHPGFEEAIRALYAGDRRRLESLTEGWPRDIRAHLLRVAFPAGF
jgi:hypothetical protein